MLDSYLQNQKITQPLLRQEVDEKLGIIVVIPAFQETDLLKSLESLANCKPPQSKVEVIIVFNASEKSSKEVRQLHRKTAAEIEAWQRNTEALFFRVYVIEQHYLPEKNAGVGLARKIGMDEAVRRFQAAKNPKGIILCFDADSSCLSNYLISIENYFQSNPEKSAVSINFEHPLEGKEFPEAVYAGICHYELHLRYYKLGLAYAELPFAYHTIGSSMAVRADAYCNQGGMNKRKAGEDFYFLQKFIAIDQLGELKSTTVIPSPRSSQRVPFGTGRAISEMIDGKRDISLTYDFEIFELLRSTFKSVENCYESSMDLNSVFLEFVGKQQWEKKLAELRKNSTDSIRFQKRFFQWFNAFKALKFIHFLRDHYYPLSPLSEEVPKLISKIQADFSFQSAHQSLLLLRKLEKQKDDIF